MDDRSERLRRRRKQSTGRSAERAESPDEVSPNEEGDSTGDDQTGDSERDVPIKEKQVGTYMYLPETQTKELRRLYNVLKAEYEFEYDEEFEKNRHFYPLIIQHGLDGLDGLDASEIRDRLEAYYE